MKNLENTEECKGSMALLLGDREIVKCCPYKVKDFKDKICEYLGNIAFTDGTSCRRCTYGDSIRVPKSIWR